MDCRLRRLPDCSSRMKNLFLALALAVPLVCSAVSPSDSTIVKKCPSPAVNISVRAASSFVLNAGVTEVLKHTVHELRPLHDDNNSFPSRHTSWVFMASTVLANEFYNYSPWIPWLTQGAASAVALQRVAYHHHYGGDVVAGALVGIGSTEIGYLLGGLFTGCPLRVESSVAEFRTSLTLFSEAVYNISDPDGGKLCTGFATGVRVGVPISEKFGFSVSGRVASTPLKVDGRYFSAVSAAALTLGGMGHFRLANSSLALEPGIEAGIARNFRPRNWQKPTLSFVADASCGLVWHLTDRFAVRSAASYRVTTLRGAISAITISAGSVILF